MTKKAYFMAICIISCISQNDAEMVDQLQDKTDNVAVIVDAEGETLEDYYDVGNRVMYKKVPDYVNRRNVQVEQDRKLPYEPSFGWVGRTSFGGDPYNINNRVGNIVPTYDPYQNYDEEIQPRNEFAIDYDADDLVQDQFGFDFDRSDDVIEDGFGTDDLFFNAETKLNSQPSQRNSDDYSDEYQVQDYGVAPRNEQRDFDDFDSGDIFRTVPKPAITFGF